MGLINHEHCTVGLGKIGNRCEGGHIPIHRKECIGDNELLALRSGSQEPPQICNIAMFVAVELGAAEAYPVVDRGMVESIAEHRGSPTAHGLKDPDIGRVAPVENQGGLGTLPRSKLVLQYLIEFRRCRNQATRRIPREVPGKELGGRLADIGSLMQSEVTVGGDIDTRDRALIDVRRGLTEESARSTLADLGLDAPQKGS